MEGGQGVRRKQRGRGTGGGEPAEDIGRRLGFVRAGRAGSVRPAGRPGPDGISSKTSVSPTNSSERSGGPLVAKLSKSRNASKVETDSIRWASSTTRSGRWPSRRQGGQLASHLAECGVKGTWRSRAGRRVRRRDARPARPRTGRETSHGSPDRPARSPAAAPAASCPSRADRRARPAPGRARAHTAAVATRRRGSERRRKPTG